MYPRLRGLEPTVFMDRRLSFLETPRSTPLRSSVPLFLHFTAINLVERSADRFSRTELFFFASYQGTQQSGSPGESGLHHDSPGGERVERANADLSSPHTPVIDPTDRQDRSRDNTIPNNRITLATGEFLHRVLPAPEPECQHLSFSPVSRPRQNIRRWPRSTTAHQTRSVFVRYFLDDYPLDRIWKRDGIRARHELDIQLSLPVPGHYHR